MDTILEIFNNREIAIGIWGILVISILLFTKPAHEFLKTALPILFCKKFVVFYVVFISFLVAVIGLLKWINFWDISLLKDTIFWVVFVELPLFAKAIDKAKDHRFFFELFKKNIKVITLFEFLIDFWTFSLIAEIILIPLTVTISFLYALSEKEKKHKPAKNFFNGLITLWGIIIVIYAIYNTISSPETFFNKDVLKSFILPIALLILNMPVVYGLSLYNGYEQLFIRIKDGAKQKLRMKLQLLFFCGINLSKVTAVRKNISNTLFVSLSADDLKENLKKLNHHLSMQIGDNYMKRSNYYLFANIIAVIGSVIGLILTNSDVSIKDLLTFNFSIVVPRMQDILTYIFSVSLVMSIALLIFSIGFRKKKNEEISQVKKYAIFEFLYSLKRQKEQLQEYPPIDEPISLFVNYMVIANDIKISATKVLDAYGNLLNAWERESIESLKFSAIALLSNVTIGDKEFLEYDVTSFCEYYNGKVKTAITNKDFNSFTSPMKIDIEKYSKKIEITFEDFKYYY